MLKSDVKELQPHMHLNTNWKDYSVAPIYYVHINICTYKYMRLYIFYNFKAYVAPLSAWFAEHGMSVYFVRCYLRLLIY